MSSKGKPEQGSFTTFRKSMSKGKRVSTTSLSELSQTAELIIPYPAETNKVKLAPIRPYEKKPNPPLKLKKKSIQAQKQQPLSAAKTEQSLFATSLSSFRQTSKPNQPASFGSESSLFTSYYQTETKNWIKPSDYIKEIKQLNLEGDSDGLEIKLSDNLTRNLQKVEKLFGIMEKWIAILRRALFYTESQKTNSDKLAEELRYWAELSRKFDSLQYEFNNEKTRKLYLLMEHGTRIKPEYQESLKEFQRLKGEVVALTNPIKKLQLCLEDKLAKIISDLEESENIANSLSILREIMIQLGNIFQEHKLSRNRMAIINKKINLNLIKKVLASNLTPSSVSNPALSKQHFTLIDQLMSFFSHFLCVMQEAEHQDSDLISKVEYQRQVVSQLLQILNFACYLDKNKSPAAKSHLKELRLVDVPADCNIFDISSEQIWGSLMNSIRKVEQMYPEFTESM